MWTKIPSEIMDELEQIRKFTRKTSNEASITYCKRPHKDKLYIGADFEGDNLGTEVGDCAEKFGTGSRIGDAHSHPIGYDSPGIVPSNADIAGSMEESYNSRRPQINCITAPGADIVHCMQPKGIPTSKKLKGYNANPKNSLAINPYITDHITEDFNIALFDAKSGVKLDNPDPKRILDNTLRKSPRFLRKAVRQMEYGIFCEYIQDTMNPTDDRIHDQCKVELKKRGLLDYLGIY